MLNIFVAAILILIFVVLPITIAIWVGKAGYRLGTRLGQNANGVAVSGKKTGEYGPVKNNEFYVFVVTVLIGMVLSFSNIYLFPWTGNGFSFERDFIDSFVKCSNPTIAVEQVNILRNCLLSTAVGMVFLLFRLFPLSREIPRRVMTLDRGAVSLFSLSVITLAAVLIISRVVLAYEPIVDCNGTYMKVPYLLYSTLFVWASGLMIFMMSFVPISIYFRYFRKEAP
ncbi:hypothetical protein [Emcibacter sp.]|uniref:hypothetical protein n=1 Tax=Emcibacter sp. TaxID=1979954 RepID=UPI003A8F88A9